MQRPLSNYYGAYFVLLMMTLFGAMSEATSQDAQQIYVKENKAKEVNVEITTHLGDQQSFVELDVVSFFITLDHAAYLYIFYRDASGQLFQLLPGNAQAEHFFEAGFYIPFPQKNSAFEFEVQAPFGQESLWVFASEKEQIAFKTKGLNNGLIQLDMSYLELIEQIRKTSSQLFGQAQLILHTRKR